jgi:tRNA (cytidine/uridine-2'-O-)-methyltransferase
MIHIALYQPRIPPNTGNIARQCVGMNAPLHLIGPIAFDLSDHAVKRSGVDYWPNLNLTLHDSPEHFLAWLGDRRVWPVSTHGRLRYDRADYADGDVLLFGNETDGLPAAWRDRWADRLVRIPMPGAVRSYNLSNAVALVAGQAYSTAGLWAEQ